MKNFNINQTDFDSGFEAGVAKATQMEKATLKRLLYEFILDHTVLETLAIEEFKSNRLRKADQASFIQGFVSGFVEQGTTD